MHSRAVGSVIVAGFFAATAGLSAFGQERHAARDNSGRQLAVVVPAPPRSAPVSGLAPIPGLSEKSVDRTSRRPDASAFKGLTSVNTVPMQLSPEMKEAVEKGVVVAQGLQKIAFRRATDVAAWVGTMWRQFNEIPSISPARDLGPAAPAPGSMRPIEDPGKSHQLYFTSESRIKTVVGQ